VAADPLIRPGTPLPAGCTVRRAGWDDLDAVVALFATCGRAAIGRATVRRDDLRVRWLELGGFDDVLLVEHADADPPLVAYLELQVDVDPWSEALDLHTEGRIHPDWRGIGLADHLLADVGSRVRTLLRDAGETQAVVRTTVYDGDTDARRFLLARGFAPVRYLLELRLDLHAAPPRPSWPEGVRCRPFERGRDERAAWEAHQRAFADVATHLPLGFADWVADRIERDARFDPGLLLLADHQTEGIVGLLVGRAGADGAPEDGWVRDLGVVPAWRRRGVGMGLLRAGFSAFRARGLTGVALEVDDVTLDGAVALYRRAGMRITERTDVLERRVGLA
jgi:mycothiol synthase